MVVAAILKALEIATKQPELREKLWENADYFHTQLRGLGIDTGMSTTYVMPLVIGDRERMYRFGHELRRKKVFGLRRLITRLCLTIASAFAPVSRPSTRADLDEALNILADTLVPAALQSA